jgi:hypothetical protein
MSLKKLQDELRGLAEPGIVSRHDQTNLHLTRPEFMEKMKIEQHGQGLLDLLEDGEHRIAERMGLINGYYGDGGVIYFDIPSWNSLVAHLTAVYLV